MTLRGQKEMPGDIFRDLLADPRSRRGRVSVVHAAINASIEHFGKRLREATVGAHGICQVRDLAVYREVKAISSEENSQRVSRSTAEAAVSRWVLRMVGRRHLPYPIRVSFGVGVAVGVSGSDRGHRSPEAVKVLGIPARNYRVSARGGKHSEETGVV